MKNSKSHKYTYIQLTTVTTVLHLLAGLFVASLFLFEIQTSNNKLLCYILGGLIIAGLIYNLAFANILSKRLEALSKYLQLLFVLVELLAIVYFTGGISSIWYPVLLIMIIACSVLGFGAFFANVALITSVYVGSIVLSLAQGQSLTQNFNLFPATVACLVISAVVAYASDLYAKGNKSLKQASSSLDGANMSERLILGSIADALIGIDTAGKIILMNEAAQTLTGWDMHDALNFNCSQVLKLKGADDKDVLGANDPFLAVLHSKQPIRSSNYHLLTKGNERRDLSVSIAPTFNSASDISGAVAVIVDISEQKALERQKEEFVSTASHEMRTPVAAIEGYIAMASNPKLAQIDDKARGFLDKAHSSSVHLGKLFQDLLSVSKIEDRDLKETKAVVNISDLVLKIATDMQIIANSKGLHLTTHIGGAGIKNQTVIAPTYNVLVDPEKISEVVTNLVDNAIKYTAQGSVDIEIEGDKESVTVRVRDTGIGISSQEQKHLFEKFYRVNNTMTREHSGTGLGLYIARNLVELYGGRIWVESVLGRGSAFAFKLPLVK
ncbi:MAG: ATP-binding protein [bacterium]